MRSARLATVALAVAASLALDAAPARAAEPAGWRSWWSFDVPAGWTETTANHAAELARQPQVRGMLAYTGPSGTIEVVLFEARVPGATGIVRKALAFNEITTRAMITKTVPEIRHGQREDGNALVVDHLLRRPDGMMLISRRIQGVDHAGGFVTITGMCAGLESACGPALAGLRVDHTQLQALDADLGGALRSTGLSDEILSVKTVAFVLLFGGTALLVWLRQRKRARERDGMQLKIRD